MATVRTEYCGMEGEGKNLTEAKKDAARKLSAIMEGDWDPYYLVHQGWIAIVVRTPKVWFHPWGYKTFGPDDKSQRFYQSSNYTSRKDAVEAAAYHLAQCAGSYAGLEEYLASGRQRQLDVYFAWQKAYATAKAEGLSDDECRERANRLC